MKLGDIEAIRIECINPNCPNVWYVQTAQPHFPVMCVNCGSAWGFITEAKRKELEKDDAMH